MLLHTSLTTPACPAVLWCAQVNAEVRFLMARLDFTDFYKEQ